MGVAFVVLGGCGGSMVGIPLQRSENLSADGSARDWEVLSARYVREDQVVVGAAIDSGNLYVLLRFRQPQYAAQIQQGGLTVAFDPWGGARKHYVLHYRGSPLTAGGDVASALEAERRRFRSAAEGRPGAEQELTIEIAGEIEKKRIPVTGEEGPSAASGYDNDLFVYEFRIPLGESDVRFYRLNMQSPPTEVGIQFEWGGKPNEDLVADIVSGGRMGEGMFPPPERGGRFGEFNEDADRAHPGRHRVRLRAVLGAE